MIRQTNSPTWPPVNLRLPDSIDEIERGRMPAKRQRELFDGDTDDDSVLSRLKRIKQNETLLGNCTNTDMNCD